MANTKLLGRFGEAAVADYLRAHGYQIVASNYYSRFGELDLIAENKQCLCFVEVKLRRDDRFAQAREYVTPAKQRKLRATAELYLSEHETKKQPRFDVAEVYAPQGIQTVLPKICYFENAF